LTVTHICFKKICMGPLTLLYSFKSYCHIPYSGPCFPSLLLPSFPLCMLYFSRISPATSVHHPT
jgi:hypothetical protein